jgi:hypothetical protein
LRPTNGVSPALSHRPNHPHDFGGGSDIIKTYEPSNRITVRKEVARQFVVDDYDSGGCLVIDRAKRAT